MKFAWFTRLVSNIMKFTKCKNEECAGRGIDKYNGLCQHCHTTLLLERQCSLLEEIREKVSNTSVMANDLSPNESRVSHIKTTFIPTIEKTETITERISTKVSKDKQNINASVEALKKMQEK